jgi:hypothetical protein
MNMVSSRSHAIFSVILKQTRIENLEKNKENNAPTTVSSAATKRKSKKKSLTSKITSKFHFVDLAGSERVIINIFLSFMIIFFIIEINICLYLFIKNLLL